MTYRKIINYQKMIVTKQFLTKYKYLLFLHENNYDQMTFLKLKTLLLKEDHLHYFKIKLNILKRFLKFKSIHALFNGPTIVIASDSLDALLFFLKYKINQYLFRNYIALTIFLNNVFYFPAYILNMWQNKISLHVLSRFLIIPISFLISKLIFIYQKFFEILRLFIKYKQ